MLDSHCSRFTLQLRYYSGMILITGMSSFKENLAIVFFQIFTLVILS